MPLSHQSTDKILAQILKLCRCAGVFQDGHFMPHFLLSTATTTKQTKGKKILFFSLLLQLQHMKAKVTLPMQKHHSVLLLLKPVPTLSTITFCGHFWCCSSRSPAKRHCRWLCHCHSPLCPATSCSSPAASGSWFWHRTPLKQQTPWSWGWSVSGEGWAWGRGWQVRSEPPLRKRRSSPGEAQGLAGNQDWY